MVTNWETGQVYNLVTQNFTHTGNIIGGCYPGRSGRQLPQRYGLERFREHAELEQEYLRNGSHDSVFVVPVSQYHPLSGWQSMTTQNGLSGWAQPADQTSSCAVAAVKDYWLLVDNPSQRLTRPAMPVSASVSFRSVASAAEPPLASMAPRRSREWWPR